MLSTEFLYTKRVYSQHLTKITKPCNIQCTGRENALNLIDSFELDIY